MSYEILITEINRIPVNDEPNPVKREERTERLKMTIDGELDIPMVIKAITIPKRKRNAKKGAS